MKIIVRSEAHRFCIPIPTAFLFSRPMVKLWLRAMRKSQKYVELPEQAGAAIWNLPEEKVLRLCDAVRDIKKKHKHWVLVEVESASGEHILIEL